MHSHGGSKSAAHMYCFGPGSEHISGSEKQAYMVIEKIQRENEEKKMKTNHLTVLHLFNVEDKHSEQLYKELKETLLLVKDDGHDEIYSCNNIKFRFLRASGTKAGLERNTIVVFGGDNDDERITLYREFQKACIMQKTPRYTPESVYIMNCSSKQLQFTWPEDGSAIIASRHDDLNMKVMLITFPAGTRYNGVNFTKSTVDLSLSAKAREKQPTLETPTVINEIPSFEDYVLPSDKTITIAVSLMPINTLPTPAAEPDGTEGGGSGSGRGSDARSEAGAGAGVGTQRQGEDEATGARAKGDDNKGESGAEGGAAD